MSARTRYPCWVFVSINPTSSFTAPILHRTQSPRSEQASKDRRRAPGGLAHQAGHPLEIPLEQQGNQEFEQGADEPIGQRGTELGMSVQARASSGGRRLKLVSHDNRQVPGGERLFDGERIERLPIEDCLDQRTNAMRA